MATGKGRSVMVRPQRPLLKQAPTGSRLLGGKNPQLNVPTPITGRDNLGSPIPQEVIDAIVIGVRDSLASLDPAGWFSPLQPQRPIAQEAAKGRLVDYAVGFNLRQQPRMDEAISFEQLRALADNCDIVRLIIETRKDQIESVDWEVQPKEDTKVKVSDADLQLANAFFLHPSSEHDWGGWIRTLLDDLFVIDAVAIYPRWQRGGNLYSLDLMDSAMIKRVIDDGGRTPLPPDPAYQQRIRGMLAVNYSADELFYFMRNPRSYKFYGFSPVEQMIITVNTIIRKNLFQLQYFTEGNIPEAIAGVPESWTLEELRAFQVYWDSLIEGNTAQRRHMKFMPLDPTKIKETKAPELKDIFDEWLARVACFAFSISPSALVRDTNKATAETVAEQARKEGLLPLLNFLKRKFDYLISRYLKIEGAEWVWDLEAEIDPATQAAIDQIYVTLKVRTPDEVREERFGDPPLTDEQKESAWPTPVPMGATDADGNPLETGKVGAKPVKGAMAPKVGAKPAGAKPAGVNTGSQPGGIGKLVISPIINIPERSVTVGDVNVTADLSTAFEKVVGGNSKE
jgi:hypothetical protein